jgi:alkyl hydroperoxide reductase subunit AhpC
MIRRFIISFAAAALAQGCATVKGDTQDEGLINPTPNKLGMGALVGRRLQGALPPLGSYELQDLDRYKGKVVAVFVWDSSSSVCKDALGYFTKVAEEYKDRGVQVVSINVDGDYHTAELARDEAKVTFPILSDPRGELTRKLGLTELPATLIVDGEGLVSAQFTGYDERLGAAMISALHDEVKSQPVKLTNEVAVHRGPAMASLDESEIATAKPAAHVTRSAPVRAHRSHGRKTHRHHRSR